MFSKMSLYNSVYFVVCLQFVFQITFYSDIRYSKYLKSVAFSITVYQKLTHCMWFPNIAMDFVFVLDIVMLYFLAVRFTCYAIVWFFCFSSTTKLP